MDFLTRLEWKRIYVVSGLAVIFGLGPAPLEAAVSIGSIEDAYTQHFDSLLTDGVGTWTDDSTLAGWYSSRTGIAGYPRNGLTSLVSFGSSSASSERALGFSGYGSSTDSVGFGVNLVNDTGAAVHSVTVSFFGEKWYANMNEGAYAGGLEFSYGVGVTPGVGSATTAVPELDFDPAGNVVIGSDGNLFLFGDGYYLLDGNHADYRTWITHTFIIGGGWQSGENLMLVWTGGEFGANPSDGLAIDDLVVSFNATPVPEPSAAGLMAAMAAMAAAGAVAGRRRRR